MKPFMDSFSPSSTKSSMKLVSHYSFPIFIFNSMSIKFKIGQDVIVNTKEITDKKGTVRYIGKIEGKPDEYIGVELDESFGKNNGDYEGKIYFKVEKKADKGQLYGVFVKATSLKPAPEKKTAPGARAGKAVQPPPPAQGKTKLSNELFEQQNTEMQTLKQELQAAYEKIRQFESLDAVKQIQGLKNSVKQLQEINRNRKLEVEQVRYKTDNNQEEKLKEMTDKINFFQNLKESSEREKAELKKKIERLEEEIEQGDEREEMLETLTMKVETLESKNEKLKSDLEAANVQIKNSTMLGSGKSNEELEQSITTLNEMVALLESDLNEEKDKNLKLEEQIETNATRLNELVKLERQLKSRKEQVQSLRLELQALSDATTLVENLTLTGFKKDQQLKQQSKRLKEFAERINKLQSQAVQTQQVIQMQGQELQHLQDEIAKNLTERQQKNKHIQLLNDQMNKYKQKIRELTDNNSSLIQTMDNQDEESVYKNIFNPDIYQHKYFELSRLHQITQSRFLDYQLQMSTVRQYSGTYLANLIDTLPEAFCSRLYPHLINILLRITSANHKLYLLFDIISGALTHKSEMYTQEQQNLTNCFLMLLDQIPMLYGSLLKIEFAIVSADGEEDIAEIVSNSEFKDQITRIDVFTHELLERISNETFDPDIGFVYIELVEVFDKVCESVKRLPTELATRQQLCVETMRAIQQLLSSFQTYRRNSQARETAQVDTMLENFLKNLEEYLRECCTNPHIRLKSDMRSYLSGVDLIVSLLKEIELNDAIHELNSLYSDVEEIKMLKDTVLTTQFHLKELANDLQQLSYPSPLSRVHVKMPGKLWQDKLREMRDELGKFQATLAEKVELERLNAEHKRKILILQKEIKDRQSTKELHERRIGELQLKVEQANLNESEFKRQAEKFRNLEDANKLIEDELNSQIKKKKEVEDELKKTKEKFDIFQTETMMKQKKQKTASNLSNEDLSNLAIFKTVLAEAGALRNHATKRKLHQLAFSPILTSKVQAPKQQSNRREVMRSLAEVKIGKGFQEIQTQLRKAEFKLPSSSQQDYLLGNLFLRSNKQILTIDINNRQVVGY